MITGPAVWLKALAAGQKRALYTFTIEDYQVTILSFYPDECNVSGAQIIDGIIVSTGGYGIVPYGQAPGYGN